MAKLKTSMSLEQSVGAVLAQRREETEQQRESTITLRSVWTVEQATLFLRGAQSEIANQILYFYVLGSDEGYQIRDKLVGVISARKLLLSPGEMKLGEIMDQHLVTLRDTDTLFDACEVFAMHRLLAIPVVDKDNRFLGVLDVSVYTDEVFDLAQKKSSDEMFQLLGLHLEELRNASFLASYKLRMPWLITNVLGGLACALIGSLFQEALEKILLISLFIPIMLTLCESIAMQSMTLSLQRIVSDKTSRATVWKHLPKEWLTALLLGLTCGVLVMGVAHFWTSPRGIPLLIGGVITVNMLLAATVGLVIPILVARLKLNPSVASGPIALALTDMAAMVCYLGATAWAIAHP